MVALVSRIKQSCESIFICTVEARTAVTSEISFISTIVTITLFLVLLSLLGEVSGELEWLTSPWSILTITVETWKLALSLLFVLYKVYAFLEVDAVVGISIFGEIGHGVAHNFTS